MKYGKIISTDAIGRCPKGSLDPAHYRDDGMSCLCERPCGPVRVFEFKLGAVFAFTYEEARALASEHGLWDRRPDGTWGREATGAHAQLCKDQQAAFRAIARRENEAARAALGGGDR